MKYFINCETLEDVKQLYKKLARDLHPDCNPDRDTTAEFQEMNNEYEKAFENCKRFHRNAAGEKYESDKNADEAPSEYADIINTLLHLAGLAIELCGSWLWVSGDTKTHKDALKALGFKFSAKKAAWYYHKDPYHRHGKKVYSMNDIRNMYGSQRFAGSTNTTAWKLKTSTQRGGKQHEIQDH